MRKRIALLSLAGLVGLGAIALAAFMTTNGVSATETYDLLAGNRGGVGEDVGDVVIWNDDTEITIYYSPDSPWCLTEVHVCVTTDSRLLDKWLPPGNAGKCAELGGFHVGLEFDTCKDEYSVTVPLSAISAGCGETVYVQAHAVVENRCTGREETAYGNEFKASFAHPLCPC